MQLTFKIVLSALHNGWDPPQKVKTNFLIGELPHKPYGHCDNQKRVFSEKMEVLWTKTVTFIT